MSTTTITISSIVNDYVTNAGGYELYTILNNAITNNDLVYLSFKGILGTSSSFLNSSLGALVDEYGIGILGRIKPIDVTSVQAAILTKYIASLREIA
jgi:hypothetical protein